MNEVYKIIWSPQAENSYLNILEFLIENWSVKVALNFEEKVEEYFKLLSKHPKLCIASKSKKNIRKCIVTHQTSFAYRIVNNTIELITFFDNRSSHNY